MPVVFSKTPWFRWTKLELLRSRFTGLPTWPAGADRAKLSAAWMIDQCGWKGVQENGAAVSSQHALVLVNQGQTSGHHIPKLSAKIVDSVAQNFGVFLQTEPKIYKRPDP